VSLLRCDWCGGSGITEATSGMHLCQGIMSRGPMFSAVLTTDNSNPHVEHKATPQDVLDHMRPLMVTEAGRAAMGSDAIKAPATGGQAEVRAALAAHIREFFSARGMLNASDAAAGVFSDDCDDLAEWLTTTADLSITLRRRS